MPEFVEGFLNESFLFESVLHGRCGCSFTPADDTASSLVGGSGFSVGIVLGAEW